MANFVAVDTLPPGAIVKDDGTAVFPGSRRPDGTYRKDKPIRKLADGKWFVPQEEMTKFQTKGAILRDSAPKVPGLPPGAGGGGGEGGGALQPGPNAAKNAKKAEAKKKKREEEKKAADAAAAAEAEKVAAEEAAAEARRAAAEADPAGAMAKTVKQLKKKLKQVLELQAKVDAQGDGVAINDEQAAKLAKRPELEASLKEAEDAFAALSVGE